MTLVGVKFELSIIHFREHRLGFPNYNAFLSLKIVFTLCRLLTTLQTVLNQIRREKNIQPDLDPN